MTTTDKKSKLIGMSLQLLIAEPKRSIDFYTTKLGFNIDFHYSDFYWGISRDGYSIHLKLADGEYAGRHKEKGNEDLDIYFSVSDIELLCEELKQKNVPFLQPLRQMDYGKEFYVQDPDGYMLGFVETP